jgi:hypothetical protein
MTLEGRRFDFHCSGRFALTCIAIVLADNCSVKEITTHACCPRMCGLFLFSNGSFSLW